MAKEIKCIVKFEKPPLWRFRMQMEWLYEQIYICLEEIRKEEKENGKSKNTEREVQFNEYEEQSQNP